MFLIVNPQKNWVDLSKYKKKQEIKKNSGSAQTVILEVNKNIAQIPNMYYVLINMKLKIYKQAFKRVLCFTVNMTMN